MSFNKRRPSRACAAFTLTELMFGIGLGGLIVTVIGAMVLYSGRNFATLANYADMDSSVLYATEQLSRDIRSANGLLSYATNAITLRTDTSNSLTYTYSANARTLTRNDGVTSKVILRECDSLNFYVYQRTPIEGSLEQYAPGDTNETKVVYVNWACSRTIFGQKVNTDAGSSSRIVMRVN